MNLLDYDRLLPFNYRISPFCMVDSKMKDVVAVVEVVDISCSFLDVLEFVLRGSDKKKTDCPSVLCGLLPLEHLGFSFTLQAIKLQ